MCVLVCAGNVLYRVGDNPGPALCVLARFCATEGHPQPGGFGLFVPLGWREVCCRVIDGRGGPAVGVRRGEQATPRWGGRTERLRGSGVSGKSVLRSGLRETEETGKVLTQKAIQP